MHLLYIFFINNTLINENNVLRKLKLILIYSIIV